MEQAAAKARHKPKTKLEDPQDRVLHIWHRSRVFFAETRFTMASGDGIITVSRVQLTPTRFVPGDSVFNIPRGGISPVVLEQYVMPIDEQLTHANTVGKHFLFCSA